MKVFQLILVLCLLFAFNCKSSRTILQCSINNAPDFAVNIFMSVFNQNPGTAYSMLNSQRSTITSYIKNCL